MSNHISNSAARGRVTLVGAGPGDPELLTIKALKAIQAATVLLVDDLVSDEIVMLAAPEARVVRVGKRGGCRSTPQSFIEKLMITAALEGEIVVRLKGGDPFMFGRGGEEVESLQSAGVMVSVVNGITAGLAGASSMNTPLTHRDHARGVLFVTGHSKPGAPGVDWAAISKSAHQAQLTLVIYMGVSNALQIERGLLRGLDPETPVAIIQNASLHRQVNVTCVLAGMCQTLAREKITSPAVIVVGEVVRLGSTSKPAAQPCATSQDLPKQKWA